LHSSSRKECNMYLASVNRRRSGFGHNRSGAGVPLVRRGAVD
jgi:hypothetical protein